MLTLHQEIRLGVCSSKIGLMSPIPSNSFPTDPTQGGYIVAVLCSASSWLDRSKSFPLMQFFFVCAPLISCVALVVPLFVYHLSFF